MTRCVVLVSRELILLQRDEYKIFSGYSEHNEHNGHNFTLTEADAFTHVQ
jgi:hypothetical protein